MSQFRIKGIDYADDSLQHGLGKGSGRGRPKGSKNGQVMPGAAYMKDYKIVGQKAVGDTNLPGEQQTNRNAGQRMVNTTPARARVANGIRQGAAAAARNTVSAQTSKAPAATTRSSTPAETVAKGKNVVETVLGGSTASAGNQEKNKGFQWSERRIREAGGLNSREGRQIVYDNPTLNEDYKKQVARKYGDSDGKSYPKSVDEHLPTEDVAEQNREVHDWKWSARRVNEAGGIKSREGRQIVYDNPTLNEDYKKQLAKKYGDSDGKSYPKALDGASTTTQPAAQNTQNAQGRNLLRDAVQSGLQLAQDVYQQNRQNQQQNNNPIRNAVQSGLQLAQDVYQQNQGGNQLSQGQQNQGTNQQPQGRQAGGQQNQGGNQQPADQNSIGNAPVRGSVQSGLQIAQNRPQAQQAQGGGTPANPVPMDQQSSEVGVRQPDPEQTQQKETEEQKSLWDKVSGWFSQAGKDVGDAVVGAWNTTSGAVSDAADWVGEKLGDAGDWAQTAYNDVSDWVGNRSKEFGDWLGVASGDVGRTVGNAFNTAGQWIGNAANDVGQWVGNTANDVGSSIGNWWNGQDVEVNDNGRYRQGHVNGARENIGNALNAAGQWIGNTANDAGRWVGNTASNLADNVLGRYQVVDTDENGNLVYNNQRQGGLVNDAGRWIGNAANDVGQWVGDRATDIWEGSRRYVPGENSRVVTNPDGSQTTINYGGRYERGGGLRDALNGAGQWIGNAANDAGRWIGNTATGLADDVLGSYQVVDTDENGNLIYGNQRQGGLINNTVRDVGRSLNNAAQAADQFVNGPQPGSPESQPYFDVNSGRWVDPTTQTLGDRIGQFANDNIVVPVRNAANSVGQAVGDGFDFVRNTANTAQAVGNAGAASDIASRAISAGVPLEMVNHWNQNYANGQIDEQDYEDLVDRYISNNAVSPVSGSANDAGQQIGRAASNVGQWIGNAANDVRRTVGNAADAAGRWIGDTANAAGQAANEWWNGTDQSFLGIPTGHTPGARENIGNTVNNLGQTVGNAVNDIGTQISVPSVVNSARSSGVPQAALEDLEAQYRSGELNPAEYVESLNRAAEYYRYQNSH